MRVLVHSSHRSFYRLPFRHFILIISDPNKKSVIENLWQKKSNYYLLSNCHSLWLDNNNTVIFKISNLQCFFFIFNEEANRSIKRNKKKSKTIGNIAIMLPKYEQQCWRDDDWGCNIINNKIITIKCLKR